jgi:hypothetical protein
VEVVVVVTVVEVVVVVTVVDVLVDVVGGALVVVVLGGDSTSVGTQSSARSISLISSGPKRFRVKTSSSPKREADRVRKHTSCGRSNTTASSPSRLAGVQSRVGFRRSTTTLSTASATVTPRMGANRGAPWLVRA